MTDREFIYWLKGVLASKSNGLDASSISIILDELEAVLKKPVSSTFAPTTTYDIPAGFTARGSDWNQPKQVQ